MRFLVTAGPTHEPIDAVRYLGNRSSGRMGIAIAEAARSRGHHVTLLLGPVPAPADDAGIDLVRFRTTDDLRRLLAKHAPAADIIVMAAAVADFRPAGPPVEGKLERGASLRLDLEPTPDLLAELTSHRRPGQLIVGFALEEPSRLDERAAAKLSRKRVDAIVANALRTMDADDVEGTLLVADGRRLAPDAAGAIPKAQFARWLVESLLRLSAERPKEQPTQRESP